MESLSFKEPIEMSIINSTINVHVYIEILDNFFIPSIGKKGDHGNNKSSYGLKVIKAFLQENQTKSMTYQETVWIKFKREISGGNFEKCSMRIIHPPKKTYWHSRKLELLR